MTMTPKIRGKHLCLKRQGAWQFAGDCVMNHCDIWGDQK